MPIQQQNASFAKNLGGRVSQANAEHKDKPIDTGNRRLPAGVRDGVAKLSAMYTKEQTEDGAKTPRGQVFFRASAIVVSPESFNGEKIAGAVTQVIIPLCDVPAKGKRKAKSFSENFNEFQNLFKLLGVAPCPETPQTDPTGQRTEQYFNAAMKMLTDPARTKTNPVFISFSTRSWKPDKEPNETQEQYNAREAMTLEDWHGLANFTQASNPGAGVREDGPPTPGLTAPAFDDGASPQSPYHGTAPQPSPNGAGTAQPPVTYDRNNGPGPQYQPDSTPPDLADVVAALVETAMNDPEGMTQEGVEAARRLEQLAWQAGWTQEQTSTPPAPFSNDWAGIGDMALNPPGTGTTIPAAAPVAPSTPTVGSKWLFAKRDSNGSKLVNASTNQPFPPLEVEVTAVDAAARTCTIKTTKDGKEVQTIRSPKKPIAVKFEWLEPLA